MSFFKLTRGHDLFTLGRMRKRVSQFFAGSSTIAFCDCTGKCALSRSGNSLRGTRASFAACHPVGLHNNPASRLSFQLFSIGNTLFQAYLEPVIDNLLGANSSEKYLDVITRRATVSTTRLPVAGSAGRNLSSAPRTAVHCTKSGPVKFGFFGFVFISRSFFPIVLLSTTASPQ